MGTIALLGAGAGAPGTYVFTNAEAATYVAAMSVQPDNTRKGVIDTLFTGLKAGTLGGVNLLTVLDVLYLFAAHDSQASLLNAITPSSTAAAGVNSPTFTTDVGYTGNGTSSYVDTNYNPTTYPGSVMALNSSSMTFWSNTAATQTASAAGWFDGTDGFTVLTRNASDISGFRVNQASQSATLASATTSGDGLWAVDRSGVNTTKFLRNGVVKGTPTLANQTSTALNNATLRAGSVAAASFSALQFCSFSAGASIGSNNTHLDLYNALRAYMTAVGVP